MIALLGLFVWDGRSALAAGDREWEVTILGATDDMPAQDFKRIVIDAFPPGLLDPESNFTRSAAYRPDSRYRLIFVFHGDAAFDHTSLCKDTGEGGPGMRVEHHSRSDEHKSEIQ